MYAAPNCIKGLDNGTCGSRGGGKKCNRYKDGGKVYCSNDGWCGPQHSHGKVNSWDTVKYRKNAAYDSNSSMCALALR